MNLIWNNKLAALLAGASMLAAVEFSNIYVPDNIDDKFAFRIIQLAKKVARLGARFNYASEMEIFRGFIHFLSWLDRRPSRKNTTVLVN